MPKTDEGPGVETIGGRGNELRECMAYLSNPADHVAISAQPTPGPALARSSGHSAGP